MSYGSYSLRGSLKQKQKKGLDLTTWLLLIPAIPFMIIFVVVGYLIEGVFDLMGTERGRTGSNL